ncbi:MAG: hypothetical protein R3202_03395 [Candidatus Competibacterales bacterium]|nr:hypothetical protein [Candidatus Competibacterales bacterium]
MEFRKSLAVLGAAGLLAWGTAAAVDTTIDDFSQNQSVATDPGTNSSTTSAPLPGASRTITVNKTGGTGNDVSADVGNGRFRYSQDTSVFGNGEVDWTGLGGLDLSFQEQIVVRIAISDFSAPVTFTVTSPSGQSQLTRQSPALASNDDLVFDFSGVGSADFSNITGLTLFLDGSSVNALDMEIDEILARGPGACEFDPSIPADDPGCEPPPEPCSFNPDIPADDPACVPPPSVPGISGIGLTVGLLGLPLIAGLLGGLRRHR